MVWLVFSDITLTFPVLVTGDNGKRYGLQLDVDSWLSLYISVLSEASPILYYQFVIHFFYNQLFRWYGMNFTEKDQKKAECVL